MKTSCYDRDWAVTVLAVDDRRDRDLVTTCREMFSRKATWRSADRTPSVAAGAYRSRVKHFTGEIAEAAEASADIREVTVGGDVFYDYPIFAGTVALKRRVVVVALPYVNLSRELWTTGLRNTFAEGDFLAPQIGRIFRAIAARKVSDVSEALSEGGNLTILRSGRVNITNDPNLHGLVLVGSNVMQSDLYKRLNPAIDDETGFAWLSRTAAKFGFWGTGRRRIVLRLDRFGNFRLRPGRLGERLADFIDFLRFLDEIKAVDWRPDFPGSRAVDMTSDQM